MIHITGNVTRSRIGNMMVDGIQPNAYDIRLNAVYGFADDSPMILTEQSKTHRETFPWPVTVHADTGEEFFVLPPGVYDCLAEENITVAEGEAGFIITRSSLNRNGVTAHSGLYDSGYDGPVGFILKVEGGPVRIARGTRVAQLLMFDAETLHSYDGDYNQQFSRYE